MSYPPRGSIEAVKKWLAEVAATDGVSAATLVVGKTTRYAIINKLTALGVIEKTTKAVNTGTGRMAATYRIIDAALLATWDHDEARFVADVWPAAVAFEAARGGRGVPESIPETAPEGVPELVLTTPDDPRIIESMLGPSFEIREVPTDALDLLAERMLAFLAILERVDARLSRLEKAWGIEEAS